MSRLDLSVIIPFKDKAEMTNRALSSLIGFGPRVKEILLISNNSCDRQLEQLRSLVHNQKNCKIIEYNYPFNYQKICNFGALHSSGKYILFLNNDTELTNKSVGLLESMFKKASSPSVGMVGCLLLYGDGKTIQHAGVFLRPGLQGDHLYVGKSFKKILNSPNSLKYPYDITEPRPVTAVTGAVQMIERKKFDCVNGFDERFIICGGDVDLCIRLNKAGYQTWYIGSTKYIIHKESQSRSHKPIPYTDFYYSYKSYIQGYNLLCGDPFLPKITESMK